MVGPIKKPDAGAPGETDFGASPYSQPPSDEPTPRSMVDTMTEEIGVAQASLFVQLLAPGAALVTAEQMFRDTDEILHFCDFVTGTPGTPDRIAETDIVVRTMSAGEIHKLGGMWLPHTGFPVFVPQATVDAVRRYAMADIRKTMDLWKKVPMYAYEATTRIGWRWPLLAQEQQDELVAEGVPRP